MAKVNSITCAIADCMGRRHSLVHGDYSPKNLLTDGSSLMVIDWECVHYGNPAFDAAFLLNADAGGGTYDAH